MASVTIRKLDTAVLTALKARAAVNQRSLEAELRHILTEATRSVSAAEFRALAERIAAMTPAVPQTDSTELLREDRRR